MRVPKEVAECLDLPLRSRGSLLKALTRRTSLGRPGSRVPQVTPPESDVPRARSPLQDQRPQLLPPSLSPEASGSYGVAPVCTSRFRLLPPSSSPDAPHPGSVNPGGWLRNRRDPRQPLPSCGVEAGKEGGEGGAEAEERPWAGAKRSSQG